MLLEWRDLIREQIEPAIFWRMCDAAHFPPAFSQLLLAGSVRSDDVEMGEAIGFRYVPDSSLSRPVPPSAGTARTADPGSIAQRFQGGDFRARIYGLQYPGFVVVAVGVEQ